MPVSVISAALPPTVQERLATDDDPKLWIEVLRAVAEDALVLQANAARSKLYAVIGSCSHWVRPHQSRWRAAGGFALPVGYGDGEGFFRGLPNLDWSVTLQFDHGEPGWVVPEQPPTKRFRSVRLAIPTRTSRHRQAAVHAVWSRGTLDSKQKRTVFYGFRNSVDGWKLLARLQRGE
jgi:hypothetical protein